jgi:hypothetical protein
MKALTKIALAIISAVVIMTIAETIGSYIYQASSFEVARTITYIVMVLFNVSLFIYYENWLSLGVYIFCAIFLYPPLIVGVLATIACSIGQCFAF